METSWTIVSLLFTVFIIWKLLLSSLLTYAKASFKLGKNRVGIIFHPFTTLTKLMQTNSNKYGNSHAFYQNLIHKQPDIQFIVLITLGLHAILMIDPNIIKKVTTDHFRDVSKRGFLIFRDQVEKGLFFAQGNQWKQSRSIISNIFKFQMVKSWEFVMNKVIQQKTDNLENGSPNIFKLGCSIGGEIVIKVLFGEDFFKIKFGNNNPHEEIHDIVVQMAKETSSPLYLLRCFLFGRINKDSILLTKSQKKLRDQLLKFKSKCMEFLVKQKIQFEKGETVTPFLQSFFNLKNDQYLQQVIHHLFVFLIAGQDTTGTLIEACLAYLSLHPQYQNNILQSLKLEEVYNSKILLNLISEVNRINPPVQLSAIRKVVSPFEIDGFRLEIGTIVLISFGTSMISQKFWDDAKQFQPKRFEKPYDSIAYLPFSSGPRNCIGQHMALMEVRITLSKIIQKFTIIRKGDKLKTHFLGIVNPLTDSHFVVFEKR